MNGKFCRIVKTLMLSAALTGCAEQAEMGGVNNMDAPIVLTTTVGGSGTRAAADVQSAQLASSSVVNVCFTDGNVVSSAGAAMTSTTGTANGTGALTLTDNPRLKAGETQCGVTAYSPQTVTTTTASFTVQTDQSTDANYRSSDLLVAEATAVRSADAATAALRFSHRMAKVQITVSAGGGLRTIKSVRLKQMLPTATLAAGSATVTAAGGTATDVVMMSGGTGSTATCAAVVPPLQTIAAGTAFLAVETDLGTVSYALSQAQRLEAGAVYSLTLEPSRSDLGQTVTLDALAATDAETRPEHRNRLAFHMADGTTFNMVRIKGGATNLTVNSGQTDGNRPAITIDAAIADYYIGETEVTQGLWKSVMGGLVTTAGGSTALDTQSQTGDFFPVAFLTGNAIDAFIAALNAKTIGTRPAGTEFVLPSLSQWVYAANGGDGSSFPYRYSGSDDLNDVAWTTENTSVLKPVAGLKPNGLGLYDMTGNVCEWTSTEKPNDASRRFGCGGSYPDAASDVTLAMASCAYANGYSATAHSGKNWGIRLALVRKPQVGDLYFSDGTWGAMDDNPGKTPIGIVFSTSPSAKDQALGYRHGYVLSLCYAANGKNTSGWGKSKANSSGAVGWGRNDKQYTDMLVSDAVAANFNTLISDMDGLTHCKTAYATNGNTWDGLNAMYMAADFGSSSDKPQFAAPPQSSGWYLPSAGQLYACLKNFSSAMVGWSTYFPSAYNDAVWRYGSTGWWVWTQQCANSTVYDAWNGFVLSKGLSNAGNSTSSYAANGITTLTAGRYWWTSTEASATVVYYLHTINAAGGVGMAFNRQGSADALGKNIPDVFVRPVLAF